MARLAGRQRGRVARWQLAERGVSGSTIDRWLREGYLHPILPGVSGVGHVAPSLEADLMTAVLYAGPGAMLSHQTAAWWWGLTQRQPRQIEVSTPRQCLCVPGVKVHGRRHLDRVPHNGLPATTIPQTLLDYASAHPFNDVRYVLAEAEFHHGLDLDEVRDTAGRGKPGSATLRNAVEIHWPELARTRSHLERTFLFLCEQGGLPRPWVNRHVHGIRVDVYWPQYRLVVELDGTRGHRTQRQVDRDHSRDLELRAHGETVRRYSNPQVRYHGEAVLADVLAAIAERRAA